MEADPTMELAGRVTRLEVLVRELTRQIGRSEAITAGRLAIVDDGGVERIVLEAVAGTASVLARVPGPQGATTGIELYAAPAEDGEGPALGLCILVDGDVVGTWDLR